MDAGWTDLGSWHTLSSLQKMPEHGLTLYLKVSIQEPRNRGASLRFSGVRDIKSENTFNKPRTKAFNANA